MSSSPSTSTFEVLTLNCWGLKPISKFRKERIQAIADLLARSSQYDVVCLQEIWVRQDFELVREAVRSVLPHGKFFSSGALGAGLAILSRFPLLESTTIPYHLTGRPLGFSDFYVNKAAGSIMIDHPTIGEMDIYTTHMHAGGPEGYELGNSYRSSQAWQLSKYLTRSARQGRYVLACGDFNFQSNELPYRILRDAGKVKDAWIEFAQRRAEMRGNHDDGGRDELVERWDMVGKGIPDAEQAVDEAGVTVDSPLNSWTWGKNIPAAVRRTQGKRLDYVFHRPPSCPPRWIDYLCSAPTSTAPASKLLPPPSVELRCVDAEVVVRGLVPGKPYSYSDHFGVRARFEVVPSRGLLPSSPLTDPSSDAQLLSSAESNGSHTSVSSSTPLAELDERGTRSSDSVARTYDELARVLRHHRKVHVRHANQLFALTPPAIVLLIALTVSSAFLPLRSYLAPIFVLFGGLVGIGGVTALITGFVWGRWETGGLTRVLEELEEERRRVGIQR